MSLLITGDIQAEWSNLDRCELAWREILQICSSKKLEMIVVLGDLKQQMNPVDLRVIKWWQNAIRKAKKQGLRVLVLLGNHDRIGAYNSADNWLSVLKRAGAETYDKPECVKTRFANLYMLPFSNDLETRHNATLLKEMLSHTNKKPNILLFHHDIQGARYNQQGGKSDGALSGSDLYCDYYDLCISGHIHNPQMVSGSVERESKVQKKFKAHYVGSPFCHDWGEVNQRKRYIVIRDASFSSVYSKIPGWYDPGVHGFRNIRNKDWRNVKIRISVQCNASEDYGRRLEKARRRAERKYKGATIFVVPRFKEGTGALESTGSRYDETDERKLRRYISERLVGSLDKEKTLQYMLEKLSKCSGGIRQANNIRVLSAKGSNFLSFKDLDIDYTKKGITLIQGINEDRNGKSNGAGKTTILSPLPVAWFGRTFKGQTYDGWANRWRTKEPALIEIKTQRDDGKIVKIIRGRRPPLLRMYVDKQPVESGMKTTDKDGTQLQIEKVTGFTWQTLANAVYIDRTVSDSFLSGTKKQRTDVLSRFQNLERFEKALVLVKDDIRDLNYKIDETNSKISSIRSSIVEVKQSIKDLKIIADNQLKEAAKEFQKAKINFSLYEKKIAPKYKKIKLKWLKAAKAYEDARKQFDTEETRYVVTDSRCEQVEDLITKFKSLCKKKMCPTCSQKVGKSWLKKHSYDLTKQRDRLKKRLKNFRMLKDAAEKYSLSFENKCDKYNDALVKIDNEKLNLGHKIRLYQRNYLRLKKQTSGIAVISKAKNKLKRFEYSKDELKVKLKRYETKSKMYRFVVEAFSRDGIPAYLNKLLCPVLNHAADYYAELFSDREVQLQFLVEKGEFVPKVINPRGGQEIEDQSTGERALAGLIASFALREVAPKCNLLLLDEPGEGLDANTAKQFARALKKLEKRFESIWISTHNVHILSELSGERVITVKKHHKISRII